MNIKKILITFLISLISTNIAVAITVEEVNQVTNGQGVFVITINNHGNHDVTTRVSVRLSPDPEDFIPEERTLGCSKSVTIKARSSLETLLIKPLVGSWPHYEGIGAGLSSDNKVRVTLGSSMGQSVYYSAEYISGTKFVEVPNTSFNISSGADQINVSTTTHLPAASILSSSVPHPGSVTQHNLGSIIMPPGVSSWGGV